MHYKKGSGAPSYVEAGTYTFEVVEARNSIAKSGNEMIDLTLELSTGSKVYDHLVDHPKSIWKIDEFCEAIGYEPGDEEDLDASDCLGATGRVKVRVGETDQGRSRNEVVQYLPREVLRPTRGATTPPVKPKSDLDTEPDDIPF
jgi:Protein of unknown function (DUF669)